MGLVLGRTLAYFTDSTKSR
ncbi:MAG: hypothetical protein H7333_03400 [Bdellovibrionales bacterium]|nr:hypothetical protein [Oligoflexia bacterium]